MNKACEKVRTREYLFWLLDNDKKRHEVWAVSLELITEEVEYCDLSPLLEQFPEIDHKLLLRQKGAVDILLGMDYRGFHPVQCITRGHLRVTRSQFGSGYILTGAAQHKCQAATTTPEACNFSQGTRSIPKTVRVNHLSQQIDSFWEAEELGCNQLPTCKTCKNCPDCRYRADNLTAEEKSSVDKMQESLHMENDLPPIHIAYPLKPEAHVQKSNYKQALAVQRAHEKRIMKQGILEEYNSEMQKAIEAGTVVKLTDRELREWSGRIQDIVLFAVILCI